MSEKKESAKATVRTIRRVTRKEYLAEEKVRIVLEGLRDETSIAMCRREGTPTNLCYRWSRDFLEAGKKRLVGDTDRQADTLGDRDTGGVRAAEAAGGGAVAQKPRAQEKLAGQGAAVGLVMRRYPAEKQEIIHLVEHSASPVARTLDELDVPRSSF